MSRSPATHPRARGGALSFVRMSWVLPACALLLLVVLVSLQFAPSIIEQRRDSGIFAYIGLTIRNGGLPYVDAWDNKLPGVYFINALAFLIFGASRWALWLAENLTIFAAGMALFWLLRQVYGDRSEAWVGPLVLVLLTRHPTLTSDINFTEPYALLPQVLVLAAGYQFLRRPRSWWGFAIGFAAGVAFLIKQTTIGGALMFIPAILISRHPVLGTRQRWHWLGTIVLGGVCSLGIVALYLLVHGILDDAIAASFVAANTFHEWVSEGSVWIGRTVITTWTASLAPLVILPLSPFLVLGMRLAWRGLRQRPSADRRAATDITLRVWVTLTFFADMVLVNVTNRGYAHYYITMIPAIALLTTMSLPEVARYIVTSTGRRRKLWAGLRVYLAVLLLGVPVLTTLVRVVLSRTSLSGLERQQEVVSYVEERTDESDTVLVWGVNTVVNFLANRRSPTQFNYGYPLVMPGKLSEEYILEMVRDLERNKPTIIVDSTMIDGDRVPPLDPALRVEWWREGGRRDVANLQPIFDFVEKHCWQVDVIDGVYMYRCAYPNTSRMPLSVVTGPPVSALWKTLEPVLTSSYEAVAAQYQQQFPPEE